MPDALIERVACTKDHQAYLMDLLRLPDTEGNLEAAFTVLREYLSGLSFFQLTGLIEQAGSTPNEQAVIQLYTHWIAAQPSGSAHVFAAWFNLGVSLTRVGDRPGAVRAYQTALALRPDFHAASLNLGTVLEAVGHPDSALSVWSQALQTDEARIMLLNNRARLLEQFGRLQEAEQEMRRSLLHNPKQPDVIQHWIHVRQKMCQWPALQEGIPGLTKQDLLDHSGPLSVLALSDDIRVQREVAKNWLDRKTHATARTLAPTKPYGHARVRLGYLSSDFCRHAMSYLIAQLFESHDRSRFEIYGYCSSQDDGSEIRARVIRSFDHFRIIKEMPDERAAQLIRDDEIDVLVDLNGLTAGARPQILRWKPAPIQATYLGFVGPVPLPELDYIFCDQIVVPPNLASAYLPEPLYIGENYQANDSKREIGRVMMREEEGLPSDKFIFCCFSNHYKTTEVVFDAWMSILTRADNSILWLVGDNEWARHNMLERASRHGVDPSRIVFARRVGPEDYMSRLRLADLFLDTFPYNAGTVASDAIRMGLPLVTISGQAFASRMAGRLLTAVGGHKGITTSAEEYIDVAVSLATDKASYDTYKACFGSAKWAEGIGDVKRFASDLEHVLASLVAERHSKIAEG